MIEGTVNLGRRFQLTHVPLFLVDFIKKTIQVYLRAVINKTTIFQATIFLNRQQHVHALALLKNVGMQPQENHEILVLIFTGCGRAPRTQQFTSNIAFPNLQDTKSCHISQPN